MQEHQGPGPKEGTGRGPRIQALSEKGRRSHSEGLSDMRWAEVSVHRLPGPAPPARPPLLGWLGSGPCGGPVLLGGLGYAEEAGPHGLVAGVHEPGDVGDSEAAGGDGIQHLHLDGS